MYEEYTKEEERAVLWKIDLVILPFVRHHQPGEYTCIELTFHQMCFVFFLQYLDKQSLSYAAVFGLIEDLDMTSSQYSWSSSIFYIGQLVSEYPFIYLMSRLPLTKFVGVTMYAQLLESRWQEKTDQYLASFGVSSVCVSQHPRTMPVSQLFDSCLDSVRVPFHLHL